MSRRGATVCHRGSEMQILEAWQQHFGAYVSTHIAIFAQNSSGKLTRTILGPKRCSNVMHNGVSCFSQLLLYVPSENTFGDILKLYYGQMSIFCFRCRKNGLSKNAQNNTYFVFATPLTQYVFVLQQNIKIPNITMVL